MRRRFDGLGAVIVVPAILLTAMQQAHCKVLVQWVELGANGSSSVRAITEDGCPAVVFDGTAVQMSVRSEPMQGFADIKTAEFTVRSCEVAVPAGAIAATLSGTPLPLARANPRRIVMFGDSGCRLHPGYPTQACNDPNAWPFPEVAAAAAAARPDLVIHVGDYVYRESPCPEGNATCAGSPWGYGWDVWNADFFEPAAPLLAAAPWLVVRGNHENCGRAGEGWLRFLDPLPIDTACHDLERDFLVRLGDFAAVVVDSSKAGDPKGDTGELVATLRQQFADVRDKIPDNAWLITHRPMNGMFVMPSTRSNVVSNKVLQLALGDELPASVRMIVSGHLHYFQAVDFAGARPPQLVVGTGGDDAEVMPPETLVGADINGAKVVSAASHAGFGYMVWDRLDNTTWMGTLFDVAGKPIEHCRLADRLLSCGS
jgi:hypothetical protein